MKKPFVTVNGTERTDFILLPTLRLDQNLTSKVDTLAFTIRNYGANTYCPSVMDEVILWYGEEMETADKLFGGHIVEIEESAESVTVLKYAVQCKDYTQVMDARLVIGSYDDMTVADIIEDIKDNFLPADFTTTGVVAPMTVDKIKFNYEQPSKCFQQLAELYNYDWYVDENKDIHFFAKEANLAPFNLSDNNGTYIFNTLSIKRRADQLRNTIFVRGNDMLSTTVFTENLKHQADGINKIFKLGYRYKNYVLRTQTSAPQTAKVLTVAGGGGGGGSQGTSVASGGGGGGGVLYNATKALTTQAYTVTVGAGGTNSAGFNVGGSGGNSVFGDMTAIGGGGGGTWTVQATNGGSGGGAGENGQSLDGGLGTPGQGYNGGNDNGYDAGTPSGGAGGGGAGSVGGNATGNTTGGNGGAGFTCDISGASVGYAGGGGGAGNTAGGTATAGGGAGKGGATGQGTAGTANTGGGGGGSVTNSNEATQAGGSGGSGVVIIAYPTGKMTATGGTVTTSGGNTIHTFTTSGTFTVTAIENVATGSTTKTCGVDNLDDPAGFDALYNFQEKCVKFATAPASGTEVTFEGNIYIPLRIKWKDNTSVTKFGNEYQFLVIDSELGTSTSAKDRAKAEIVAYANQLNEGSFKTQSNGLRVGQIIGIQSAVRGFSESFVISKLTAQVMATSELIYTAQITTTRTMDFVDLMQKVVTAKNKEIEIPDDEVLIKVEGFIETVTLQEMWTVTRRPSASPNFTELVSFADSWRTQPWAGLLPIWVTGHYYPTNENDRKRTAYCDGGCLIS